VVFNVPAPGTFSVRVSDIGGRTVSTFHGIGPMTRRRIAVEGSGIYLLRVVSGGRTISHRVFVP
jgi:hypothetical protein